MSYYKGTYQECLDYDNRVTVGEAYNQDRGINWAIIHEHPNGVDYAILKHKNYEAELTELETLSTDWFPEPIE
jgi:hypothetical protein